MCFIWLVYAYLWMQIICSFVMLARFWDTLMWVFLKLRRGRLKCVLFDQPPILTIFNCKNKYSMLLNYKYNHNKEELQ